VRRVLIGALAVALGASACSSDSAASEAKAACQPATYAAPGQGSTAPPAQERGAFKAAAQHANKAAAMDARWNSLSTAYTTTVDWWTAVAKEYASDQQLDKLNGVTSTVSDAVAIVVGEYPQLAAAENQAESTIHDQCQIANAS
jgi:hypothetical protein